MKFANLFDELSVEEQKGVALFLCNAFSSGKGSEWVMYVSTWKLNDDTETSNFRIASKVAGKILNFNLAQGVVCLREIDIFVACKILILNNHSLFVLFKLMY